MFTFFKQFFYGKSRTQFFFEKLYRISLRGMNIGNGGTIETSGEFHAIKLIRNIFENEKSVTIFDVGANKGEYAEAVTKIFAGRTFRLFVFEPSKTAFSLLQKNSDLKTNEVSLIHEGISDKPSVATLYTDDLGSKLGSIYERSVPGKKFTTKEEIVLTTLDAFCAEHNINHIHFLKLDIEGNELHAIWGGRGAFEQNAIDVIQFEFGGANIDARTYFRDFWDILSPYYKIFRILKNGLREIAVYDEKLELFSTTNYLAIKKELAKDI